MSAHLAEAFTCRTSKSRQVLHLATKKEYLTDQSPVSICVGVENGYDEVNVQIPEEEKRRNLLRQTLF